MSTILQIKRSGTAGSPTELAQGELAYSYLSDNGSNGGDRLYIGTGTETDGVAANIKVIGGEYFTSKLDHTLGTLTASSALITDSNNAIDQLLVGNNATAGGGIKFNEATNNGAHSVLLKSPAALVGDVVLTLPAAAGTNGQFLKTDGSGNLSFGTVVSTLSLAADTGSNDSVSTGETITFTGGEGISTTVSDNDITIAAEDATETNKGIATFDGTDFTVTSGDVTINAERVQDITGAMFSSNTETLITATYQDGDGTIDLVVNNDLSQYDNSSSGFITTSTTDTLTNKTLTAPKFVDGGFIADANGNELILLQTETSAVNELEITNAATSNAVKIATSGGDTNIDLKLSPKGTGVVDVDSSRITNVTDPSGSQDAATKAYVDSVANGLDVKESVRVATTTALATSTYNNSNGTITADANGALSIDGAAVVQGDRVLIKDQASAVQNGIYTVTTTGSAGAAFVLTRGPDADTAAELTGGTFFFVEEGTANADNGYVATHNGTPTLGTTNITFSQFSGAGQINDGAALRKTGNTLDVLVDDTSIEVSGDTLQIKADGVGTNQLGTNAVTTLKITDANVTNAKLANSTVTVAGDTGTPQAIDLGDTLTVTGGEGIDTSQSGDTLTIAAELATTSNKGVASFSADNFTVASGAVTVTAIDGGTF